MWPWSEEFPKRKSRNNNHSELHLGQFDLYYNALPSRAPTRSRGSFSPYALISLHTRLLMHSTSHDGEEEWQGRMTRKDDKRLILCTWLPTLDSLLFT